MSNEAVLWAARQRIRPSLKATLQSLCSFHDHRSQIVRLFPSIDELKARACQDRKTIIKNLDQLEAQGLIRDTGERVGRTRQIKVYTANIGTVPKAEPFQERNNSENVPKESQERDTELNLELTSPEASPPTKPRARDRPPKAKREARAEYLPADWDPAPLPPDLARLVAAWEPGRIERELSKFRNHWGAAGGQNARKRDWNRAWWNWLLNADERGNQNHERSPAHFGRSRPSPGPDPGLEMWRNAAHELEEEEGIAGNSATDRGARRALPTADNSEH